MHAGRCQVPRAVLGAALAGLEREPGPMDPRNVLAWLGRLASGRDAILKFADFRRRSSVFWGRRKS